MREYQLRKVLFKQHFFVSIKSTRLSLKKIFGRLNIL